MSSIVENTLTVEDVTSDGSFICSDNVGAGAMTSQRPRSQVLCDVDDYDEYVSHSPKEDQVCELIIGDMFNAEGEIFTSADEDYSQDRMAELYSTLAEKIIDPPVKSRYATGFLVKKDLCYDEFWEKFKATTPGFDENCAYECSDEELDVEDVRVLDKETMDAYHRVYDRVFPLYRSGTTGGALDLASYATTEDVEDLEDLDDIADTEDLTGWGDQDADDASYASDEEYSGAAKYVLASYANEDDDEFEDRGCLYCGLDTCDLGNDSTEFCSTCCEAMWDDLMADHRNSRPRLATLDR